jgi:hypothetical protein
MNKTDSNRANSTSLKGYIKTTYNKLLELFGEPNAGPTGDGKVNIEWILENDEGLVATIYDWKLDRDLRLAPDEEYQWHIGGHKSAVVKELNDIIMSA